ncbi:hypothetical protein ND2E_0285 [Colwellia psychrerythraea]|uniref:Uncharacterized protein n=1 Tax=Colwellia psychrerythraea TaxID=28229 RepID=A0A099KB93_COLPS|nr:hypothetical protein ND2E_0285 [Colwellia psychrerythraea]
MKYKHKKATVPTVAYERIELLLLNPIININTGSAIC